MCLFNGPIRGTKGVLIIVLKITKVIQVASAYKSLTKRGPLQYRRVQLLN